LGKNSVAVTTWIPEQVARAVFRVLAQRVGEGEIADVRHVLPGDIRDLWP
jgi:uncharacterized protein (DUF2267 family)